MRRIFTSLAATTFILTLATAAHAQPGGRSGGHVGGGHVGGGHVGGSHVGGSHVGGGHSFSKGGSSFSKGGGSFSKGGGIGNGGGSFGKGGGIGNGGGFPKGPNSSLGSANRNVLFQLQASGFNTTPKAGFNFSFRVRPANWGQRTWCAACGCSCYWNGDAECYYYWCEPDQCYYPLDYCPYGRYDYADPD